MRNYRSLSSFILIVKNTQRYQCQYSIKIFIGFIKCVGMSEIVFNSVNRYISKIFA
ncbi:hypothetical protein [Helicobacter pylori]|uniref:hypothetical protein n=1 Tax=Helicobacter pylori TaxID=210 RepID=UPI0012FF4BA2|nr:hypothetical protein [Helicobacter pylori]